MSSLQSHLSILQSTSLASPSAPAFRLPKVNDVSSNVDEWLSVSYLQFRQDVDHYARYWAMVLASENIPSKSVVGLWLGGMSYIDVLHIYGVYRAGYVPQLFSLRLPNPTVIFELLQKAGARALIYDPSFNVDLTGSPVRCHAARVEGNLCEEFSLSPLPDVTPETDIAFIFHTSGSTSGSPKLVPCNHRWLDALVSKGQQLGRPKSSEKQDVSVWLGSMCHIGQTTMLIASIAHGSCTIQPTNVMFSSDELKDMIQRCGLNRLNQFASFLGNHLRNARQDKELLKALTGLDEVCYCGLPLGREEELWAINNGIPLVNLFGSTECASMMLSIGGKDPRGRLLRPVEGTRYSFFPISEPDDAEKCEQAYQNLNAQLLELVVLSESPDCPDHSLRKASDGHFHTGDLFLEVEPGCYAPQGRTDDWIKSENSLRCDTKAIEENVRATCSGLVFDCIVVGNGRPSPALFVEPAEQCTMDNDKLKKEIIRRTRQFHSRRYLHERIVSTALVIVVARGSLPRTATKGNIRRKVVEEQYRELLDSIY